MLKLWQKNKLIIIIMLIVVFLFPSAISKESDYTSHLICVGIGVDKNNDEYETCVQVIIPEQATSFKRKLLVHSAKGDTIQSSVDNLKMHTGKELGLAHCACMVVNEGVLDGDLINVLDFFVRKYQINYNSVVIATDKSAKDVLNLSSKLNNTQGFGLTNMLDYNNRVLFSREPNIENIYSSILGGASNYVVDIITTSKTDSDGVKTEGEDGEKQNGESSGGNQSENEKDNVLVNNSEVFLMDKGQKIDKFDMIKNFGVRYINPSNAFFDLTIANFTDENFTNATIELYSEKKYQVNKYYIQNNTPIVELDITQYFNITGIKQQEYSDKIYSISKNIFSNALIKQCQEIITNEINRSFEKLKEYNCDACHLYNAFEKYDYYKFHDFLSSLENEKDYFKHVELKANIVVKYYNE